MRVSFARHSSAKFRRGFALVVVLAVIVLLVILIVGFLSQASNERMAAAGAREAAGARQLADTAVNLVQGQINLASSQGASVAWISQPGLVRTFDNSGALLKIYKLYSSDNMVATSIDLASELPPTDWFSSPAAWTDLNAFVTDRFGTKNFPILNSDANADGYRISGAPIGSGIGANPAPMPVKWLYVLRNGQIVAPAGNGGTVTIPGESYPSGNPNDPSGNPVVGRIAFWADDETCKVNINTSSDGTFWDTPRVRTDQDIAFGNYQPARREFQRYPGHPAVTSLAAVFPSLTGDQIYQIVPRITGGGSLRGTAVAAEPIKPDTDRLYSDIDELMFAPDRAENGGLDRGMLEKARFFLTAHSRAPEETLFNLPRIACWPVFQGLSAGRVSVFDRLIALCSTINGQPYYFQRENAASPVDDISIQRNEELYAYLQKLTSMPIPGYGGTFSGKYGADRDQILTEIFDYIRSTNLYDDTLAAGNQFTAGRFADMTPKIGHGWVSPSVKGGTMGFGRAVTVSEAALGFICNAVSDDPDTTGTDESAGSNVAAGAGANAVLAGTALQKGEKIIQAIFLPEFFSAMQGFTLMRPDFQVRVEGLDVMTVTREAETFSLFPGLADETTPMNGDPGRQRPGANSNPVDNDPDKQAAIAGGQAIGGWVDWRYAISGKGSPARGPLAGDTGLTYPFIGIPIKIKAPAEGGTMRFNGGTVTVSLYAGASSPQDAAHLIQTFEIEFPAADFPIPNIARTGLGTPSELELYQWTSKQNWWSFPKAGSVGNYPGRMEYSWWGPGAYYNPAQGQFLRADCDVVRSVLPAHGDYRILAGKPAIAKSVFAPHPGYTDTSRLAASSLGGEGSHLYGIFDRAGKYISDFTYNVNFAPDIPPNGPNLPEATGDYDTGVSLFKDGPFVNKPDEGNTYRGTPASPSVPYFNDADKQALPGATFFSPNRQMPSPGMFGSLPTGVQAGIPWRTLLFRPQTGHFGASSPKDSLILDLFWMPVVEPYAISDRFSTAGKINMNYQIVPFTYIERSTALRALLKSEMTSAIPDSAISSYKAYDTADEMRKAVNLDETLKQFQAKFAAAEVFKSASDICDLHIVPEGTTLAQMDTYWNTRRLTGENLRERIYTTLYPRLTTKSNTYTVHFRAQSLRKLPASTSGTWTERRDLVTGEYRGSVIIERFINPANQDIPDYAKTPADIPGMKTLDRFYRWRTISNRQFAP